MFRRWVKAAGFEPGEGPAPTARVAGPSIVLVAIATQHADDAQLDALREAVRRLRAGGGDQRFACVTVIRPAPELGGASDEESATSQRIKHLVILRHWAEPLGLDAGQISFHVLEASDPAEAILRYARLNQVDHIVIGAPPKDVELRGMLGTVSSKVASEAAPEPLQLFRLLGTVSTKVASEAPCTVGERAARPAYTAAGRPCQPPPDAAERPPGPAKVTGRRARANALSRRAFPAV